MSTPASKRVYGGVPNITSDLCTSFHNLSQTLKNAFHVPHQTVVGLFRASMDSVMMSDRSRLT